MKLFIKNMVCSRCKMVVKAELEKLGHELNAVELGEIELKNSPDKQQLQEIEKSLHHFGFELIDTKKGRLIENIKTIIIDLVHHNNEQLKVNLSSYISEKLQHEYNYLSTLFSETEGTTIEKYFIAQKIEKVKELLIYDELSLSEIAYQLNYSSVAHLSSQFKKITGLTPSFFKALKNKKRIEIEKL